MSGRKQLAGALAAIVLRVGVADAAPPEILAAPDYGATLSLPVKTASPAMPSEQWLSFWGQRVVRNISKPTLTPVLPDPALATGAAVIVAPGGGFRMLSMDSEGMDVAHRLAEAGIAVFVLKYRLRATPEDSAGFAPAIARIFTGKATHEELDDPQATEDAFTALSLVRHDAAKWRVDPARVGILGFSAGAIVSLATTLAEDPASRPSFAGLIYGPMDAVHVPIGAPPLFVALANDDPLFGKKGFALVQSWLDARRPVELHAYESGGHGFGMRRQNKTSDGWIDDLLAWLRVRGLARQAQAVQ
jgi:acetyl esterase/lipase